MLRPWILAALLVPFVCPAQVVGNFSVDKSVFAVGEPVFLTMTLSNQGEEAQDVLTSDPYSFCSGYEIKISRQGSGPVACSQGFGGSCLSGVITLSPHGSRTEKILLNYPNPSRGDSNPPVSLPGDYTVDAFRRIGFAPQNSQMGFFESRSHAETEIHQLFDLRVDRTLKVDPATYQPFIRQLTSTDLEMRRDAARTLATIAPPALEPLLITFATSKDAVLKQFAPLALANLASEASLSALAEMLTSTAPGSYEFMSAADFLGKTHDPKWLPTLLKVADKHGAMYLPDAAQSGGEAALPAILARLNSVGPDERGHVIYALGSTGSLAAVPVLIGLLKTSNSPDSQVSTNDAWSANAALQQLTHRYLRQPLEGAWVDAAHQRWQGWWFNSGNNSHTYRPGECVPDVELP